MGINELYKNCQIVSTHGIRTVCDFYPDDDNTFSIETFDWSTLKNNSIVFVKPEKMGYFYYNYLHRIPNNIQFSILGNESDEELRPEYFRNMDDFLKFINDIRIKYFFIQNNVIKHPKVIIIPIGVHYHVLNKNPPSDWSNKIMTPFDQEEKIFEIRKNGKPISERILKIYTYHHFFMNGKYCFDRRDSLNMIPHNLQEIQKERQHVYDTFENAVKYAFISSPHSNGLTCHRTFEAIALGCIPIVKKSCVDELYDGLPVLIVNEWSDINEDLLKETIIKFKDLISTIPERLTNKYWIDFIKSKAK
jgi:hypothetical protein